MTRIEDLPPLPALVVGQVGHTRRAPLDNSFRHGSHLWLVDVDDLPDHGWLGTFRVEDHLAGVGTSLRENVARFLSAQGHRDPVGRMVMLAGARVAGHVFDPLSVFWCFSPEGELTAVVAEVHNTYGERDAYLLRPDERNESTADKKFFVSPFFDVSGTYRISFELSPQRVAVSVELQRDTTEPPVFSATFWGRPRPATPAAVRALALRQPLMPQRVTALIRWEGVKLWARRLPVLQRPDHEPAAGVTADAPPWERVGAPPRVPGRAAAARTLVARACRVAGVPLHLTDETPVNPAGRTGIIASRVAFHRLGAEPKLGLAAAYIAGEWAVGEDTDLATVLTGFATRFEQLLPSWAWRARALTDRSHPEETDQQGDGARANVGAHYDLSNDLFEAFLDPSMTYSSALFSAPEQSLHAAQLAKIDAVLDLARVGPGTRLLEIGTGWGALAVRAAQRGAQVVSVTLSSEQLALARARVDEAGVGDQVELRLQDYRDVTGTFDAVVSVEMIEAVGERYWGDYLATIEARLVPGGRAAVQAITMGHDRFLATRHSHGWIQEFIFPGGLIPSFEAIAIETRARTSLRLRRERRFGGDYARTLRAWRERFLRDPAGGVQGSAPHSQERFRRMWELYLAYCEAGFASGYIDVEHWLLERPQEARA